MLTRLLVSAVLALAAGLSLSQDQESRQSKLVLDDNLWVTFCDLPSRRFREIRTAILARNYSGASRDLTVSANYISVEADRTPDALREPLYDVVTQLRSLAEATENPTLHDLDLLFGRTCWLLAQHYLVMARHAPRCS
jgi:hypothetical protein